MRTVERATDSPRLLKLKDAAAMYSVSYELLHDAVLAGSLPAIKPSRAWLVEPDAVMAFLRQMHAEKVEAGA